MLDDAAVDISEAEASALELVAELGVVDSKLVENGGLQVVHMDGILVVVMLVGVDRIAVGVDDFGAVFVSVADGDSSLDTASGHPH